MNRVHLKAFLHRNAEYWEPFGMEVERRVRAGVGSLNSRDRAALKTDLRRSAVHKKTSD